MSSDSENQQNDSDDWTLISSPHSSTSGPEEASNKSSLHSSIENLSEENLSEIDLNEPRVRNVTGNELECSNKTEHLVPGFQAICSSSDEDCEEETNSRRSSRTSSDCLDDYVNVAEIITGSINLSDHNEDLNTSCSGVAVQTDSNGIETDISLRLLKTRLDELSRETSNSSTLKLKTCRNFFFFALPFIMLIFSAFLASMQNSKETSRYEKQYHESFDKYLKHTGRRSNKLKYRIRHVGELQKFDDEVRRCVERQSPTAFRSLSSDMKDRFKDSEQTSRRPSKGMVCFGQESYWLKKVEEFKSEYNLDLRMISSNRDNDNLEFTQIATHFRFIMNQIEYLDYLEEKRKKRQTEELIKYLKAENNQLLRRLNEPNETGYQKLVVNLELENSRLRRENEVLKARLVQKAGPTYIKQSLELEYHERENVMLKKFHNHVALEVVKALKQFNLHIIDPSTILDDEESLSSQLALTRGYLRRLSDKIETMLIENESLKVELEDSYSMKSKQLAQATSTSNSYLGLVNDSNALSADSCARNLQEERTKTNRLELELEKLRNDCLLGKRVQLELGSNRQLNRSSPVSEENSIIAHPFSWMSRLQGASGKTVPKDMSIGNDEMDDDILVFLTKYNDQILADRRMTLVKGSVQEKTTMAFGKDLGSSDNEVKIIPNYIREAFRQTKKTVVKHQPVGLSCVPSPRNFCYTPVTISKSEHLKYDHPSDRNNTSKLNLPPPFNRLSKNATQANAEPKLNAIADDMNFKTPLHELSPPSDNVDYPSSIYKDNYDSGNKKKKVRQSKRDCQSILDYELSKHRCKLSRKLKFALNKDRKSRKMYKYKS